MQRGDTWEAADPARLWKHCAEIHITTEPSITVALRKAFAEIDPECGHVRDDTAYEVVCAGERLYEFSWHSISIGCRMYLKFSVFDGRLVIVSFHKSKKINIHAGKKTP